MNLHNAKFIRSAVRVEDFPHDSLPQIIFAGKSNVGKSSVINRLLNRKNFARVGGEPGKTVHINFFEIDEAAYFVDLPGYGYAKVSKAERRRWGELIEEFFAQNTQIALGIHIVDMRHPPTQDDRQMAHWFAQTGMPRLVIANKSDKLKPSQRQACLDVIRQDLLLPETVPLIPFSAEKGEGREAVLSHILTAVQDHHS